MNLPLLSAEQILLSQVSDLILEVANLYNEVDTSDLQGIASANASKILSLVQAKQTNKPDVVPVYYWNSKEYGADEDSTQPYQMQIDDQRKSKGQVFIDVAAEDGDVDDMLCATIEVSRLPGSKTDVPCLHLHFDGDNLAASFFKQNNKFVIRTETDVTIRTTTLPNGESGLILE